ncbi:alpha/beta hydrolase [Saccharomonospora piscinae]|uniref:alpha/beta fold hydrolase n=1 Tax=Saccharomonospora piscinae TaxID=687388 RepID=UPI001106BE49|nr:alpha/beta hydrolase [Saccharomonospora piscinae]TLW92329.1 alpha/beta hydrolase [Saccharomonospora piscinae]
MTAGMSPSMSPSTSPRPVEAGGRRLRALVQGVSGDLPTVVFLSTLGCPLEVWTRVRQAVAEHTMTISYDRGNVRWNGREATVPRRADELEDLLTALRVDGPVVLVGHAYGALVAEEFARTRTDRVAGMVLADAWRSDELLRLVHQRRAMAYLETQLQRSLLMTLARPGKHARFVAFDALPDEQRQAAYRYLQRPLHWRTALAELVAWKHSRPAAPDAWPPHRVPVLVVVSQPHVEHDQARLRMQQELAASSTRSGLMVIPEATNLELVTDGRFSPHVAGAVVQALGKDLVAEGA